MLTLDRPAPSILSSIRPVEEMTDHWFLAQVQVNRELGIARDLAQCGLDYFLPITSIRTIRHYAGRKETRITHRPLFPGWLFVNGDRSRDAVARSKFRFSVFPMSLKYEPKLREELRGLEAAMAYDAELGVAKLFRAGSVVRVKEQHPMGGFCGRIERIDDVVGRLWMNIQILGSSVCLEIDMDLVEPA